MCHIQLKSYFCKKLISPKFTSRPILSDVFKTGAQEQGDQIGRIFADCFLWTVFVKFSGSPNYGLLTSIVQFVLNMTKNRTGHIMGSIFTLIGANPTIASYNASVVKIHSAVNSMASS
jgi:hypothetical protein